MAALKVKHKRKTQANHRRPHPGFDTLQFHETERYLLALFLSKKEECSLGARVCQLRKNNQSVRIVAKILFTTVWHHSDAGRMLGENSLTSIMI